MGELLHVPVVAVSVDMRCAVPLIVGSDTFWGSGWAWTMSAELCALAVRPGEVTRPRRRSCGWRRPR